MRAHVRYALIAVSAATTVICGSACSSNDAVSAASPSDGGPGADGGLRADEDAAAAVASRDGASESGLDSGPPAVQLIGRFEKDGANDVFAFPGSTIIAGFEGPTAVVKLTQTDGSAGGPSWFNVLVDGVLSAPFSASAGTADYTVAHDLGAGPHVVEIEKRTESIFGVVRFDGFTFPGGRLASPPPRSARRIEFITDSTIDGFGIEGSRFPADTNYCGAGSPPQYDNARKSVAGQTAATLGAERFLIGYSGKGLTKNEVPEDTLLFGTLYDRALPDSPTSVWNRASWVPDAVVVSLGGVDFDLQTTEPPGFAAAYGGLVDRVRTSYPDAHVWLTVWAGIKNDNNGPRDAMIASLQGMVAARSDAKMYVYAFPPANVDTDETGCEFHSNATHHAAMAALLVAQIRSKITAWQ